MYQHVQVVTSKFLRSIHYGLYFYLQLSADDMLIARMYASLTPEDKKSFLESFIEDGHNKANRSLSDKTKAS